MKALNLIPTFLFAIHAFLLTIPPTPAEAVPPGAKISRPDYGQIKGQTWSTIIEASKTDPRSWPRYVESITPVPSQVITDEDGYLLLGRNSVLTITGAGIYFEVAPILEGSMTDFTTGPNLFRGASGSSYTFNKPGEFLIRVNVKATGQTYTMRKVEVKK